jgi:hypothetical protein
MLTTASEKCRTFNSIVLSTFFNQGEISLRKRQAKSGQIFLFLIILVIGALIIIGLLQVLSGRGRVSPTVKEATWLVGDHEVTTATLGTEVEARITIATTEQYAGSIVVRIKKDVSMWFDKDFTVSTIPVDLAGGDQETITLNFTPDEASGGGLGGLRGYFIEVEFQTARSTWDMESTYPPRLTIRT